MIEESRFFPFFIALFFLSLIIFSIYFKGGEYLHTESKKYLFSYLDNRPILQKIFDVKTNDWGAYQSREFSYFIDIIDANFIKYSIKLGFPHFYAVSHFIGLAMILAFAYIICTKFLKLKSPLIYCLLGGLFLTAPSTFFSGVFLRSAKILVAVFFTLIFYLILRSLTKKININPFIVPLSLLMSLSDRQGYFFLLSFAFIFFILTVYSFFFNKKQLLIFKKIFLIFAFSAIIVNVYTYFIGPRLIKTFAGYQPDLSYMNLDLKTWLREDPKPEVGEMDKKIISIFSDSTNLLFDIVGYFFGNIPAFIVAGVLLSILVIFVKKHEWLTLLTLLASFALILCMYFLMVVKHPPVAWPGIRHTYYNLATNALILFFTIFIVARLIIFWPSSKVLIASLFCLMIVFNILALSEDYRMIQLVNAPREHEYAPRLLHCLKEKGTPLNFFWPPDEAQAICGALRKM